jgi:hypothetical protein
MKRDDRSPIHDRHSVHGAQRQMLESIRDSILDLSPDIEEVIANGMLRYPGRGW